MTKVEICNVTSKMQLWMSSSSGADTLVILIKPVLKYPLMATRDPEGKHMCGNLQMLPKVTVTCSSSGAAKVFLTFKSTISSPKMDSVCPEVE